MIIAIVIAALVIAAALSEMRKQERDEANGSPPPPPVSQTLRSIGYYGPDHGRVHGSDLHHDMHIEITERND